MTAQPRQPMSYAEYLVAEAKSDVKHDYVNGEAYARAGGTIEHGALAVAFAQQVFCGSQGQPCRAFNSDVRVRVESTGGTFYPDLSVVCGKLESSADDQHAIANPVVLVEVLSEGTEAYDRGAKAGHYRRLASLREYVLVSQTERKVEVQRLTARGTWELFFFGPGERVQLESIEISFSVDDLYANPLS
ncbi:MAG: Uma2 family endonuclease [Archangium sp.]